MIFKGWIICALLFVIQQASIPLSAQTTGNSGASSQTLPASLTDLSHSPDNPPAKIECESGAGGYVLPHITIANPAPATELWTWHDRIAWAATLILALVGYVGITLAISTLKKIEGQLRSVESIAAAVADSAEAALLNAQAIAHAERPWILISVEPSPSTPNSFTIVATNRGRSPAKVIAFAEQIRIATDEAHLPAKPVYENAKPTVPRSQLILLPGESVGIKPFSREDLKTICQTAEHLKRIENWEERVFIHGMVIYEDLIALPEKQTYETSWCCWYIHGRQKSGLVHAGPPEYNKHT